MLSRVTKRWNIVRQIESAGSTTAGFAVAIGAEESLADDDALFAGQGPIHIAVRDKLVIFTTAMAL